MTHPLRRLWCAFLLCFLAPVAAAAAMLAEADARAVRQVVQAQLDAIAADDAERAFSYASPSIQIQLVDASSFMAMVRSGYPMVVQPAAVSFFQPQADDLAKEAAASVPQAVYARQAVQLRDREGRLWVATYLMERQPDMGWRISGCMVKTDNGKSSI